jgi:hypothetical protein
MRDIQWIWDKRKTKAHTEARSVQEAIQKVYAPLKESQELKIKDDQWSMAAGELGRNMEAMCMMVHALGYDVDLEEYPRLEHQVDTIPNRGHQQEPTVDAENDRRDGAGEVEGRRFASSP